MYEIARWSYKPRWRVLFYARSILALSMQIMYIGRRKINRFSCIRIYSTMIIFDSTKFNDFELPDFKIGRGEIVRIESSDRNQAVALYKQLCKSKFDKIIVGKRIERNLFNKISRVGEYLRKKGGLSEPEITQFCEKARVRINERLFSLTTAQKIAVDLATQYNRRDKVLLLSTMGMYLDLLVVCYEILSRVLKDGVSCLEITYPPFSGDELHKSMSPGLGALENGEDSLSKSLGPRIKVLSWPFSK